MTSVLGPLVEIKRRIESKGPINFAEFMEVALYFDDGGYYVTDASRWGERGDYITNLDSSPVFFRLLAVQLHEMWLHMGSLPRFDIIEVGAGRGLLTKGVLESVQAHYPDFHHAVTARCVERNPHLRQNDQRKCTWHSDISELTPGIIGAFISNELVDALAVHRVIQTGGGLGEVYVGLERGELVDVISEPSTPELARYLDRSGITLVLGQRMEIPLAAAQWIERVGGILERGFVLTIDYGLPARELYVPERAGTLLCHFRHTMNDDPYRLVGEQDITTQVDFSGLVSAGRGVGLEPTGFTTQRHFLLGLGVLEELIAVEGTGVGELEAIKHNQGIKELVMPGGMGDTFKVLCQHKGVKRPALSGFSFKNMIDYL